MKGKNMLKYLSIFILIGFMFSDIFKDFTKFYRRMRGYTSIKIHLKRESSQNLNADLIPDSYYFTKKYYKYDFLGNYYVYDIYTRFNILKNSYFYLNMTYEPNNIYHSFNNDYRGYTINSGFRFNISRRNYIDLRYYESKSFYFKTQAYNQPWEYYSKNKNSDISVMDKYTYTYNNRSLNLSFNGYLGKIRNILNIKIYNTKLGYFKTDNFPDIYQSAKKVYVNETAKWNTSIDYRIYYRPTDKLSINFNYRFTPRVYNWMNYPYSYNQNMLSLNTTYNIARYTSLLFGVSRNISMYRFENPYKTYTWNTSFEDYDNSKYIDNFADVRNRIFDDVYFGVAFR